jgi:hypothetical protein
VNADNMAECCDVTKECERDSLDLPVSSRFMLDRVYPCGNPDEGAKARKQTVVHKCGRSRSAGMERIDDGCRTTVGASSFLLQVET